MLRMVSDQLASGSEFVAQFRLATRHMSDNPETRRLLSDIL
jgi:hypothetical protein